MVLVLLYVSGIIPRNLSADRPPPPAELVQNAELEREGIKYCGMTHICPRVYQVLRYDSYMPMAHIYPRVYQVLRYGSYMSACVSSTAV